MASGWQQGEQTTVMAAFDRAVDQYAEDPFLDFSGFAFTYGQFHAEVNRVANGLAGEGVSHGDTVCTMLDNGPDAVIAWMAANRLGAVSVPINTAYKGSFLRHQVNDSAARLVVAESHYADRFLAIEDEIPAVERILHRGDFSSRAPARLSMSSFDEVRTDDISTPGGPLKPKDLAALIYTAGTTGPSKGCMVSHNYMCNLARQIVRSIDRQRDELHWNPLPLFHLNATASTVVASLLLGAPASIAPRFSLSGFWPEIQRTGARIITALGSMLTLVAQMDETSEMRECYGQIRVVRGSPFPAELQRTWTERFGIEEPGSHSYGLTEASLVLSTPAGVSPPPGSSGRSNEDFEVLIVDDDDIEVAAGEVGEVIVRPSKPHVMFEGYWQRPEATAAVTRNLWFHTGDLGRIDEDGWFYFADRKKDYLRRRGENISSQELETAIREHPALSEVAVHAVPSELTEDDVKLTVVLHDGEHVDEEDLCRWVIERVPYFAVPRYIEVRRELPKNPFGRVQKYLLRDEGVTDRTWDREKAGVTVKR